MPISSLNSKKCSMAKLAPWLIATSLLALAGSSSTWAAPSIEATLRTDIRKRKGAEFGQLLKNWSKRHGARAVPPLLKIASDRKLQDADRYVALMAATKLGGTGITRDLAAFLNDRSWMLRSAALRALGALGDSAQAEKVLPLLRDPALVVRTEAVETVRRLKPSGGVDALVEAIESPQNYHRGKAQWVPQKALSALIELKPSSRIAPRIAALLKRQTDPSLQQSALSTLEAITGKRLRPGAPLPEKVEAWLKELEPQRT